jgi:hypothetical protein
MTLLNSLLLSLVSLLPAREYSKFELVYHGEIPAALGRFDVKSGHFREDKKECLVVQDSTCFRTFGFDAGAWKPSDTIPFAPTWDTFGINTWTVGDINDDARDEILSVAGHVLITYSWNGKSFVSQKQELPYFVDDIKVGDIANDGRNELVMLTYKRPFEGSYQWDSYGIVVARYSDTGILPVWNDNKELKIARNGSWPSDNLVCIADVMGVGHNQLLCAVGQSDVEANIYYVLQWSDGGLKRVNRLIIEDGKLVLDPSADDPRNFEYGSSIGDWIPAEIGGESGFLIPWYTATAGMERTDVLARIRQGKLEVADTLLRPGSHDFNAFWVDPDGRGKGILELFNYSGTDSSRFYREEGTERGP